MTNYRLWDCTEDQWLGVEKDLNTEAEALEWRQKEMEDHLEHCKNVAPEHGEWVKRNFPQGHYTLFAFIVGEEPAI